MAQSSQFSRWSDTLEQDLGWGMSAWQGADEFTPMRNKLLRNKLVAPGLVCMSDGNVYIFHTGLNIWCVACSKQAITFVNNLLGMEIASVSYTGAYEPYVYSIDREASDRIASPVPQSVCIGTERLRVAVVPGGLELSRCESLLSFIPAEKKILAPLCYMPLSIKGWPRKWVRTSDYRIYRSIAPLFVDPAELQTVEWSTGHALIDPKSYSKTVLLYGEGGRGKSTILKMLDAVLLGCCGTIPDDALTDLRSGLKAHIAAIVASNRIVTAGDVGAENRSTNLTVIKSLTGHDFLSIPPSRVKTGCTLFYASNTLDDPLLSAEWLTAAIMRRVVVVPIYPTVYDNFDDYISYDKIARLDFALRCVHTRLTHPYMPVTPLSVLHTLMGSRFQAVSKYLAPVREEDSYEDDVIDANNIIAGALSTTTENIGQLASRISRSAVVEIEGMYYVKNIAPVNNR